MSDILDVDTVAILLLEGDTLHARAAKGIEEEVEQGVRIPLGARLRRPHRRRAPRDRHHRRRPRRHPQPDPAREGHPLPARRPTRSSEGRVIGVLHVGSLTPREFTARRARPAPARRRPRRARHRAGAPLRAAAGGRGAAAAAAARPSSAEAFGLEAAARYLPASGGSLGGDWYDVFALAGGRVGVVVGDVVGRGVEAAAVMAQLRTAVRAYAAGRPPARRRRRPRQQPDADASARWR